MLGILVVSGMTRFIRFGMFSVKKMSAAHASQGAKRRTQILVIASCQNAATSLAKTGNPLTVRDREAVAGVHSKQP